MKKFDFILPVASALMPGIGTSIAIAGLIFARRNEPRPELPEEVIREHGRRYLREMRDLAIIIVLTTTLALTLLEIYRTENQIKLLKSHHTEHVVTMR